MKKVLSLVAFLSIIGVAAEAVTLPELDYFHNATPGEQQKINMAYAHIDELERKVEGLQDQVTKFHGRFSALESQLKILQQDKKDKTSCPCKEKPACKS